MHKYDTQVPSAAHAPRATERTGSGAADRNRRISRPGAAAALVLGNRRSDRGLGTWALAQISIGCAGLSLTEAAGFAASEIRGCKTSASRGLGHRCQADGSAVDGDHARVAKQRCLPGQCRAQLVPTALVQSTAAAYRAGVPGVGECSTGAVICIQYVCLAG